MAISNLSAVQRPTPSASSSLLLSSWALRSPEGYWPEAVQAQKLPHFCRRSWAQPTVVPPVLLTKYNLCKHGGGELQPESAIC